jgi:hydrogenase maturation factor HypF (carbamoyltransferase family)
MARGGASRIDAAGIVSEEIRICGRVQGVGLSPRVYRLAREHRLHGHVCNAGRGLRIAISGARARIDGFLRGLAFGPAVVAAARRLEGIVQCA